MINRASFRNFKALRDVDITFDSRLTVIVGQNGSGKTSVLQGLDLLGRATRLASSSPNVAAGVVQEAARLLTVTSQIKEFLLKAEIASSDKDRSEAEIVSNIKTPKNIVNPHWQGLLSLHLRALSNGQWQDSWNGQKSPEIFNKISPTFGSLAFLQLDHNKLFFTRPGMILRRKSGNSGSSGTSCPQRNRWRFDLGSR
jgi:predicted ATP-dependent endonuclease of OLD family